MALISCDTSFLFSAYGSDGFTPQAIVEMRRLRQPLSFSLLNEFEFENSVRLAVFRKVMPPADANIILADFAADANAGKIVLAMCDLSVVVKEAKNLAVAHTLTGGYRSFDLLHVAAALHLGAAEFLSFDVNQRKLAKAVGLKVRPVRS
jgi:predicted nucleic acid-binding protein